MSRWTIFDWAPKGEAAAKADAKARVHNWLRCKQEGNGDGYAPVSEEDVAELYCLFLSLIHARKTMDCDADLPIDIMLVDLTRYEPFHFRPIPRNGLSQPGDPTPKEVAEGYTRAREMAEMNLGTAMDTLQRLLRCERGGRRITKENVGEAAKLTDELLDTEVEANGPMTALARKVRKIHELLKGSIEL